VHIRPSATMIMEGMRCDRRPRPCPSCKLPSPPPPGNTGRSAPDHQLHWETARGSRWGKQGVHHDSQLKLSCTHTHDAPSLPPPRAHTYNYPFTHTHKHTNTHTHTHARAHKHNWKRTELGVTKLVVEAFVLSGAESDSATKRSILGWRAGARSLASAPGCCLAAPTNNTKKKARSKRPGGGLKISGGTKKYTSL